MHREDHAAGLARHLGFIDRWGEEGAERRRRRNTEQESGTWALESGDQESPKISVLANGRFR